MLRNYLTLAWRHLVRNRIYSMINILGLATGVACCLLIALYIQHESSYDAFHEDSDNLYIVLQQSGEDKMNRWAYSGAPMGEYLTKDFPEIESMVRYHTMGGLVKVEEKGQEQMFQEDGMIFADSNFFEFFSFEILSGNAQTMLDAPFKMVLTASQAIKLYGTTEAVGKTLTLDDKHLFQVSGVVADFPDNSHLQVDMVGSFTSLYTLLNIEGQQFTSWWWPSCQTYVRTHPEADIASLNETRLIEFIQEYREPELGINPQLLPLTDLHYYGTTGMDGVSRYVSLFGIVALFILLIACVNFMNLATARSATRALEVGVRKVVGARRTNLIRQFLGESFMVTTLAVMAGLGLAEIMLPLFNAIADMNLSIDWFSPQLWLGIGIVILIVGFLSGSYPAILLSSFRPVQVLKNNLGFGGAANWLRRGLVSAQFVISIALITCTLVIWQQHRYMLNKSLGYDQELMVNLSLKDSQMRYKTPVLKQKLEALPGVAMANGSSWSPGVDYEVSFPCQVENGEGAMKEVEGVAICYAEKDFLPTLGLEIADGRNWSEEFGTDPQEGFMVNEAMVKRLGDSSLLGRQIRISYGEFGKTLYEKKGRVVGIVKDFHSRDLHMQIRPSVYTLVHDWESGMYLFDMVVRMKEGDKQKTMADIKAVWEEVYGNRPFEYAFAQERIARAYEQEEQLGSILTAFTVLAIFIACLGLLGLAAFTAQKRTKEIGVRKVLGASQRQLLLLLNREFTLLVLISLFIAAPISYYLMQEWLAEYPYRIPFSLLPYSLAGLSALLVTWGTVSFQSVRATLMNPADALRYE